MSEIKKFLGKRIKEIRKAKHMTQPELAEKINVDPKYISRLETGSSTPSFTTIEKMANVLNVDVEKFFNISQFKEKEELIFEINNILQKTTTTNVKLLYRILSEIIITE